MLVNFTVSNYRSFKEERTFSMSAGPVREHRDSVIERGSYRVLPLAVFYGANSSGKSNLIQAISTMCKVVRDSVRMNEGDPLLHDPFALDKTSEGEPTSFEIQFLKDHALYRYGFEYNREIIISEWLYEKRFKEREYELFLRAGDDIEVSARRFPEGRGKEHMTNSNRLFLSVVAQLKGEKSNRIMSWFRGCNVVSGIDSVGYESVTIDMFAEHRPLERQAQAFFQTLQLGFTRFFVEKVSMTQEMLEALPEAIRPAFEQGVASGRVVQTRTVHNVYDERGEVSDTRIFDKDRMESEGTKKVIEISGPLFDTLSKGKILIVDELDAKLHPLLTRNIILLFMDPVTNPHGAQLIFATHDTNLLDLRILRRDQIWFAEKDSVESTDIYSLIEIRDENGNRIRNDRNIERDYIQGRYGAIPFVGRCSLSLDECHEE